MLSTDKLSRAFLAIIEETEKVQQTDIPKKARKKLKTIVSIAKHQSDVRGAKKGKCRSKHSKCH